MIVGIHSENHQLIGVSWLKYEVLFCQFIWVSRKITTNMLIGAKP